MDIYGWQEGQREALNRLDRIVASGMNGAYADLLSRTRAEMEGYRNAYAQFVARNGPPAAGIEDRPGGRHYVFQQERLDSLLRQLEGDVRTYHDTATGVITDAQHAAMRQAQVEMEAFGKAAAPADSYAEGLSFATLPEEAIRSVVGMTSNGSPLATLMQERARTNWQDAADSLRAGVALGQGPNEIATALDDSLGQSHYKNLLLARTEVMRAHHEAQRMQILQNADILAGWRWSAATDSDTCPICWANHNRVFPIHQVDGNSPTDLTTAQHRGFDDFLTKSGVDKAGTGSVDANALPDEAKVNPRERLDTALRLAEMSNWRDRRETLRIFDEDGTEVFAKQGSVDSVQLDPDEVSALSSVPGRIGTHNHPDGWNYVQTGPGGDRSSITPRNVRDHKSDDPRWTGNGLSKADIDLAATLGLAEMRAVTPAYIFSLRPPVGRSKINREEATAFRNAEMDVRRDFWSAIAAGTMTPEEASSRHHHEVLTRVAARTGAVYSRTDIGSALGGYTDATD